MGDKSKFKVGVKREKSENKVDVKVERKSEVGESINVKDKTLMIRMGSESGWLLAHAHTYTT